MGANCFTYDDAGKTTGLTDKAMEWAKQLYGFPMSDIENGFNNLKTRSNNAFPPTALEFRGLCKLGIIESAIDEIFEFINRPQDSEMWWQSKLAYNIYKKLNYRQGNNETQESLTRRIRAIAKSLQGKNLLEVPEAPAASLEYTPAPKDPERAKKGVEAMRKNMAGGFNREYVIKEIFK
jgi:hypothetical protein